MVVRLFSRACKEVLKVLGVDFFDPNASIVCQPHIRSLVGAGSVEDLG